VFAKFGPTSLSGSSNHAIGATVFSEEPPVANTTLIRAAHIVQLRPAVNALRVIGGSTAVYAGNAISEAHVKTLGIDEADFTDLRAAINSARGLSAVALPSISFSSTPEQNGGILRAHIETLRGGFRTLP
jgi:tRNA threonylcarbamoyladenosine modification (KEOPS) complex  Pcc1 subunit